MRVLGVGDISEVEYALLEQNGKLSVLKKSSDNLAHALIVDGEVDEAALKALGYDRMWLDARLTERHVQASKVFLMTVDDDGATNIIKKEK